jgi:RNA polymerase sigma-70 factor (ECF subfamily)
MQSEAAFEDIFHMHFTDLFRYCVRRVHNPVDAEDAFQDTMLRAHRALSKPGMRKPTWSWFAAIATNACRDVNHRGRRYIPHDEQTADSPVYWIDDHIDSMVRREVVAEALAALPHRYSQILILRHVGGLGHERIAGILGVSKASARNSLQRAKRALAKNIERVAQRKGSWPLPALMATWRPRFKAALEAFVPMVPGIVLGFAVTMNIISAGFSPYNQMSFSADLAAGAHATPANVVWRLPQSPNPKLAPAVLVHATSASNIDTREIYRYSVSVPEPPGTPPNIANTLRNEIVVNCGSGPNHRGPVTSLACPVLAKPQSDISPLVP